MVAHGRAWRMYRAAAASSIAIVALHAHASAAVAATGTVSMLPSLTNASICTSAEFLALPATSLDSSPITIKSLVEGEQVCLEFALTPNVADSADWFAVGLARSSDIVNAPPTSVLLFNATRGTLEAYVLSGRTTNAVAVRSSDQRGFIVASASVTAKRFSYQRLLAAATASDVAVDVTQDMHIIWAYGATSPIKSDRSGTRGAATYRFTPAPATLSPSDTTHNNITGDTSFDSIDRRNRRRDDDAVLRDRMPFCDGNRNCPAVIGGAAIALLLVGGVVITRLLAHTAVGRMLLYHTLVAPPVKTTTNSAVPSPLTMGHQALADLRAGELLVVLTFVGAVVTLVALDVDAHTSAAATAGHVVLLTLMFLLLPVSRVPLWHIFFRSSFERMVKFHRWLGVALTVAVVVHLVLALKLTAVTQTAKYGSVVPLFGFFAFLAFAAMALLANDVVRRLVYELFYISHRVLSVVGLVFAVLHAPKVIGVALAVPLAVYAVAIALQWTLAHTARVQANIAAVRVHGAVAAATLVLRPTQLTEQLAMCVRPGAFFWVKAPSVSRTQWHPFSAIVTPDGKSVGFCVQKVSGTATFTRALVSEALTKRVVPVSLSGPYGSLSLDVDAFDVVVLVAGGVGITPIVSLVNQQQQRTARRRSSSRSSSPSLSHWYVVWSVKSAEQLLMIDEFLPSLAESPVSPLVAAALPTDASLQTAATDREVAAAAPGPTLSWSLHVSTVKLNSSITRQSGERLQFKAGRPVLRQMISTERFKARGRVAVLACGPPTLMVEAQALARECGYAFHKEVFHW